MQQVTSIDGTRIAYTTQGSGEPVLLVHGGPSTGEAWDLVVPELSSRFAVTVMDRRGRGASGDADDYSLELEAADVLAVLDALGDRVHLVAHSSGARVALLAAGRTRGLCSLTLYEPPLSFAHLPESFADDLEQLVEQGRSAAAAERFLLQVAATPEETEIVKGIPAVWERLLAAMPTVPREARAMMAGSVDLEGASHIDVPVLLLVGQATTSPMFLDGLDELQAALGDVRREVIPGQRHLANAFAPEPFARLLTEFLEQVRQPAPVRTPSSA